MKDKVIIWGVGDFGRAACGYYRDRAEVVYFIDSDPGLCGKELCGLTIHQPGFLHQIDKEEFKIVIANKRHAREIQKILYSEYQIEDCTLFSISESAEEYWGGDGPEISEDQLIVTFVSGLGNQLFQYAFFMCLAKNGARVTADLSGYILPGIRPFMLETVFRIQLERCAPQLRKKYIEEPQHHYREANILEVDELSSQMEILESKKGLFEGYWLSYKYVSYAEEELRKSLVFRNTHDDGFEKIKAELLACNSVSIHVRRGDYLKRGANRIFGDICTTEYYQNAIQYIRDHVQNPQFYLFSDDAEWAKNNMAISGMHFITPDMFSQYEDWYDMQLMSLCKHNIIANSTFSWWGAWFNTNSDKIVVAPQRWTNVAIIKDICPPQWVRI